MTDETANQVTYRNIGDRIRKAREAAGLSQDDVARAIDTTGATVSRYETGQSRISIPDLFRVANVVGVPISRLITGEEISGLSADEDLLLSYFRGMTEVERESFLRYLGATSEARTRTKKVGRGRGTTSSKETPA